MEKDIETNSLQEKENNLSEKIDFILGKVTENRREINLLAIQSSVNHTELTRINGKLAKIEEDVRTIRQLINMYIKQS